MGQPPDWLNREILSEGGLASDLLDLPSLHTLISSCKLIFCQDFQRRITEMTFEILCMATIALFFGLVVAFSGYRLFLVLLPIWGFFAGFILGAQTIHFLFDVGLFATVTGWVVGFFVGMLFAVLSYLFYFIAVGIISFSLGYGATVGILAWLGLDTGWLIWLIAVVVGALVAFVVYRFNLQKYAIIVATAVGGTGLIIYTLLVLFNGAIAVSLLENPVELAIDNSFWWLLFFLVVAGLGVVAQIQANRSFEADAYNRLSEVS
jgi:hypothetical protein